MAKMGGCNDNIRIGTQSQGTMRINPGTFKRNNLAQGGVNKDLGGGATKPGKGKGHGK